MYIGRFERSTVKLGSRSSTEVFFNPAATAVCAVLVHCSAVLVRVEGQHPTHLVFFSLVNFSSSFRVDA